MPINRVDPSAAQISAAEFRAGGDGVRWPMLFFALWALIHLQGASPAEALEAVAGTT